MARSPPSLSLSMHELPERLNELKAEKSFVYPKSPEYTPRNEYLNRHRDTEDWTEAPACSFPTLTTNANSTNLSPLSLLSLLLLSPPRHTPSADCASCIFVVRAFVRRTSSPTLYITSLSLSLCTSDKRSFSISPPSFLLSLEIVASLYLYQRTHLSYRALSG